MAPRPGSKSYPQIGRRLGLVRKRFSELTRKDWAVKHGFSPTQYTNWENGTRRIPLEAAELLSDRYGLSLDWIYLGKEDNPPQSSCGWLPATLPASVHGTALAVEGRGVLLIGPSGSGKSSIALMMMGMGARLISDDIVWLEARADGPWLRYPPQAPRPVRIEARGVGLIPVEAADPAPLHLLVDLGRVETARLPDPAMIEIAGRAVRRLHKVDNPAFPAMVLQYLLKGEP